MTCGGGVSIFRLLDAIVGWDADDAKGLTDLDDNEGIHLFEASGDRLAALIPLTGVMAMTFTPDGTLVVAQHGNSRLLRFDRSGAPLTPFTPALPENAQVERIGSASGRSIWLATPGKQAGTYKLWSARFGDPAFAASSLADLAAARPHTGLTAVTANGFCIARSQAA